MRVIFIKNYKQKSIILAIIFLLWFVMYLVSEVTLNNSLIMNITINNDLKFSYPFDFQVDNIYYNEGLNANAIQTNSTLKKPTPQKLSSYNSLKGRFSFDYPTSLTLSQQDFEGSEILYHIDFYNRSEKAYGFVQVWNMNYSIKQFLDKSQASSHSKHQNFKAKSVTVNNMPGYQWEYITFGKDGNTYNGNEVFFQKNNRMYRISYFVAENHWNKSQADIFWSIVNSFKTY